MPIDRAEIREWLEANCPPRCASPGAATRTSAGADGAGCFSPRRRSSGSSAASRAASPCRPGRRNMAARGYSARGGGDSERGNARAPRPPAAGQLRHLDARPRAAQIRHGGAEARRICRASRAAKSAGARAIPSPARDRTSPRCAPGPRTRAIISSSTARRSGLPMPTRPTGSSASCAPIRPRSSRRAFPSC